MSSIKPCDIFSIYFISRNCSKKPVLSKISPIMPTSDVDGIFFVLTEILFSDVPFCFSPLFCLLFTLYQKKELFHSCSFIFLVNTCSISMLLNVLFCAVLNLWYKTFSFFALTDSRY